MKRNAVTALAVWLALTALVGWVIISLVVWPLECAARNGAYIIPQQGFPVCVAGR